MIIPHPTAAIKFSLSFPFPLILHFTSLIFQSQISFSFKNFKDCYRLCVPPPSTFHYDTVEKMERRKSAYIALRKYIFELYLNLYLRTLVEIQSFLDTFQARL